MDARDDGSTRLSLVNGLLDAGNHAAWRRFCALYQARLRWACARAGVRAADLDDVVGDVLLKVAAAMSSGFAYDPAKSFRGWLKKLCRNEAARHLKRANRPAVLRPAAAPEADEVESEWADIVTAAAERVRAAVDPKTWACFALNGIEALNAAEVAARLGLTPDAVWQNKHRVAQRIRAEVQRRLAAGP